MYKKELDDAVAAWEAAGYMAEVVHTGGNIWCAVTQIRPGLEAVAGEEEFAVFINDEWNNWVEESESISNTDYDAQIALMEKLKDPEYVFTVAY